MDATRILILGLSMTLAACASSGKPGRTASVGAYCPSGTVKVCTSLFEPSRKWRPDQCACAELVSHRILGR